MFPSDYEEFIYKSRYARWLDDENRREQWPETIDRYLDFMNHTVPLDDNLRANLFDAIVSFKVMPSMRALMTSGPALLRDNTAGFNCAFLPVDSARSFDEAMYILLCGTGVGFSVEWMFTRQLPVIRKTMKMSGNVIVVGDSKEGWAHATRQLIEELYQGRIPRYNTDLVREAGARLKTFGGRASGPEPLIELFEFLIATFMDAAGRQLTSLECHDIMCKIGEIVVVGGVRRSAMISLSDLDDREMALAKSGNWWETHPHRALANNSAVYVESPDIETFSKEWQALIDSKSGERGIFSRPASTNKAAQFGRRQVYNQLFGTNPCSEIILRPYQFCNLTEVVIRAGDTLEQILEKVATATMLGTYQSTLTDFPYLRQIWRTNTEEERLLGVSLTGIMDHAVLNGSQGFEILTKWLETMRLKAVEVNAYWADLLGIARAAAITCIKPSGTVSQLVNSASGIHARHALAYIRTVRGDNKDPMTQFMIDQGVPAEPCVMKGDSTTVFSFPISAPEGCVTRNDMTAIQQLELWMIYQDHWCEHKPSVTITVREEEWDEVGAWVFENFDKISGISFLPHSDHTYQQAPYQDVEPEAWAQLAAQMPEKINWAELGAYEIEDNTKGSQTLACSAGACELVDL